MADTTADILPLSETDDELKARLQQMRDEYGDEVLTDEEMDLVAEYDDPKLNIDDHYVNLAEFVDEQQLTRLSENVIEWAENDEEARADWYKREKKGMVLLGIVDDKKNVAPFHGATEAVHPLMIEACTQFQARAIAELWPAGGPVKGIVMGKKTPETIMQSVRVGDFMNYQYTQVNGGFDEEDRMLMRLPMSGSCFKKQYFDPQTAIVRSDYVEAADFLVPYQASSLATALRYTHRMRNVLGNDIKKLMKIGYYKMWDRMPEPMGEGQDNSIVHDAIDDAEGRAPMDYEDSSGYTLLECNCFLNLSVDGSDEIAYPYVVTVDQESQLVLSIRRGWKKGDTARRRRVQVTHYKFLPGFGFYGYGFVHVMGGLSQAATGAMRAYLDAAGLANMKGGFKSRDAKLDSDEPLGMGEWREVDMTAEELSKCFFPMEYREPSKGLFEMLGYMDSLGRRYMSITENVTGDANNNGPVGTTLALIEQGLKVFSSIHKRLHEAHHVEFQIMAGLYAEFLPQEYPYMVEGEDRTVMRTDFDARVDVIPVSDPNVATNTQRITQGQTVVELANTAPQLYDMRAVHRRMLEAMQIQKIEEVLPPPQEVPPMDPITEGAMLLTGQAVQAYPDQDHYAHMMAHRTWWENMVPEDMQKDLEPAYKAHQAEHLGHWYKVQMAMQMGIDPMMLEDPALQGQLAQGAAQVTQLMAMDNLGTLTETGDSKDAEVAADIDRKDRAAAADEDRKNLAAAGEEARKDAQAQAEIERSAVKDLVEARNEAAKTKAELNAIEDGE